MDSLLSRAFVKKTNNTYVQFFRYFYVGGIAFLIDFSLLYFLTEFFGLDYLLSTAIGFIFGSIANYLLSVKWIFVNRSVKSKRLEISIFVFIGLIGLVFNELIMWFSTDVVGFHYLVSKIVSTFMIFSWNFFVRKFVLFK